MSHERRIFIDHDLDQARRECALVGLSSDDAHYLRNVLRLKPGAVLTLIEKSSGREFQSLVAEIDPDLRLKILEERAGEACTSVIACVAVALLKGSRLDAVCEYGTELGVESFVFWQAERSISRLERSDVAKRLERWRKITEAAARQSGRRQLPRVSFAANAKDLLSILTPSYASDRRFICSLAAGSREMRELPMSAGGNCLVCGTDGHFTPGEEEALRGAGFLPVSLGPLTLRSEVAAFSAVAMANGIWGLR